jgi:hypothetical protein
VAEIVAAEADHRDGQTGLAELAVAHVDVLPRRGVASISSSPGPLLANRT